MLPGAVLPHLSQADAVQMRVLLYLASDLSLAEKTKQLSKLADCTTAQVHSALAYWLSCGVLVDGEESVSAMATVASAPLASEKTDHKAEGAVPESEKKLLRRANELPTYTSTELAELMEARAGVRAVVNEAQQILGKMFNPSEVNILVAMLDYLGMSEECVLLLLAHCKKIGKVKLRSIEKYAYSLVDRDITDVASLEEEIRTVEALHSFEGEVRAMFGMKSRALTSKESKMLRAWVSYGYDIEIVRRAYELTIASTNEPSVVYANAILERWNADGLRTAEQIDKAQEERKNLQKGSGKSGQSILGNSFDTDEFFEAALRRSFSETEG